MTKLLPLLLGAIALAGCAVGPTMELPTSGLSHHADVTVVDKSELGEIKVSALEYGNMLSCHYGTMKLDGGRMAPAPVEYMRRYLSSKITSPASIEVARFDVYTNSKARFHQGLTGAPLSPTSGQTIIGCKGAEAGEYSYDEVNNSAVPILVYLNGHFNGQPFRIRTISDVNKEGIYPSSRDLQNAIDMTLDSLIKRFAPGQ